MIEITALAKQGGPLTKRISLSKAGVTVSDGSACVMAAGEAGRVWLDGVQDFAALIERLQPHEALALGALRADLPSRVEITTKRQLDQLNGSARPDLIARTADFISYRAAEPALALIDIDTKGMPPAVAARTEALGGFWPALVSVLPELATTGHVTRTSTSSGIRRADTGEALKGSGGLHVFVLVEDGGDIERFLRVLHERCWLHGLGWLMVGAGGQLLERSLVDRTVYAPERLVFEAAPILEPPLAQDHASRAPHVADGNALDTRAVCLDLRLVELAKVRELRAADTVRLAADAAVSKRQFVTKQASKIAERTGCSRELAEHAAARQTSGTLLPGVALAFDAEEFAGATVRDVLAEPDRFVGATLADPLEGPEYGLCKAKIMRRPDGSLWIHSFAHGRTVYELRHDAAAVEAAVTAAQPTEAVNTFVRMALLADLAPDEELALRDLASARSGLKVRPISMRLMAARKEQLRDRAEVERSVDQARRTDCRLRVPVPPADAERLPIIGLLEDVLGSLQDAEPPMRDMDGHPVEVRSRPPIMLHELTAAGSNEDEPDKSRLPPPDLPLLTRHDRYTLAQLVEKHIEFTVESEAGGSRPVALPSVFVDHFSAYRDSKMPRVGAVVTAPLVMPDGKLLAPRGLDRERGLVFRIEHELMACMPAPHECSPAAVAEALDFLANTWLCDVAANFAGKCVMVALAVTILERVLLPERPAFFITAGKRGGGKTTALVMVILAVTGKRPAAAAWSPNEEERRKAVLSYLAEGLAALVWDNIPIGTAIACPTLEKVLTAPLYSGRVLGQTAHLTVPAFTVMSFTGNNIAPKGDMASRSLIARLEVDRPDPENRRFEHADPIAWTLDHRGEILRALYTILLGNPQLDANSRQPAKTRFKTWWNLVGSGIEHAAATLATIHQNMSEDPAKAAAVDFGALFAEVESEDESAAGLADVLDVFHSIWGPEPFQAADVAKLINTPMEGESDAASRVRSFFFPTERRQDVDLSGRMLGQRLKAVVGAPVWVGDRTMTLRKRDPENEARHGTGSYRIEIR